ncbi:hypothetical protein Q3G72_023981 [Acer saccharum]|nr:hypothetical protein Q3G72_023981 [Acer saccharum]
MRTGWRELRRDHEEGSPVFRQSNSESSPIRWTRGAQSSIGGGNKELRLVSQNGKLADVGRDLKERRFRLDSGAALKKTNMEGVGNGKERLGIDLPTESLGVDVDKSRDMGKVEIDVSLMSSGDVANSNFFKFSSQRKEEWVAGKKRAQVVDPKVGLGHSGGPNSDMWANGSFLQSGSREVTNFSSVHCGPNVKGVAFGHDKVKETNEGVASKIHQPGRWRRVDRGEAMYSDSSGKGPSVGIVEVEDAEGMGSEMG